MSREKSSHGRRHSRHEISRAGGSTIEQLEYTNYSFENETADQPKTSITPSKRPRARSESSTKIRSSGRHSKQVSDESKEEVESDNLTYTKYDSDSNKKNVESPINSMRKVEDYLMRQENLVSDSPDNNQETKQKRRKSKKQRKEKIRSLESKRTDHEEAYDEYDRSIERRESVSPENKHVRREKRRKSKKERKGKTRISESSRTLADDVYEGDVRKKSKKLDSDEPRISKRRKRRRSNPDTSVRAEREEKELPITEILRQAQENSRNRYEEPVPLPELTTDTIYVQRRNGFSAVKIPSDRNARRRHSEFQGLTLYPIKVAIAAQKVWNGTGLIYQGLLAGMALMHLLLIQTFFELSLDFLVDYSVIAEIYTCIFSFLVTMCVVSVFDKFDLGHLDLDHLREIYVDHSRSFLAVPLYVATFCLHQANLLVDDKISLLNYPGNSTGFEKNSTETIVEERLVTWQKVTFAKDGLAVIAWLFVVLGPSEDMLLTHLKSMEKYADSPESSRRDIVETIRGDIRDR